MINPKDYLRTVTEGTVKPDRSFIWTEDSNEDSQLSRGYEGGYKPEEPTVYAKNSDSMVVSPAQNVYKKVYCEDCSLCFWKGRPRNETSPVCLHQETSTKEVIAPTPVYKESINYIWNNCEEINKNNYCPYFVDRNKIYDLNSEKNEKWYKKLWRMFCK